MRKWIFLLACLAWLGCNQTSTTPPPASPTEQAPSKRVFFVNLNDGDTVTSPVLIQMGVEGMEVHPAGQEKPDSGHHHIVVNGSFVPEGEVVPANENHIHFGKGDTETELELPPGEHTLTLQFADYAHRSYGEALSATIKVSVEGE